MAVANAPSRVGQLLSGKYRLDALLAIGGMGEVYRGMNIAVDRPVAIKLLRPELTGTRSHVQRFIREGRAANKVNHPNIVPVLDIDRDGDQLFIVQDLLEGEDLGERLKRPPERLPIGETLDVMIRVADALGVAHDSGLVHRDLKPANVFIADEGGRRVPKILDFGIAKMAAEDGEGDSLVTHTGMQLGTPAYMSPEQIMAPRDVDARADVWALGVLLHRTLSGKLPFRRDSAGGLMVAICTEPHHPLAEDLPGVPALIVEVVERCLQKDPDRRFADGGGVAAALKRVREQLGDGLDDAQALTDAQAERAETTTRRPSPGPGALPELELELELDSPPPASERRPRKADEAPASKRAAPAPAKKPEEMPRPETAPEREAPPPKPVAAASSTPRLVTQGPHSQGRVAVVAPAAPVEPVAFSTEMTRLAIATVPVGVAIAVGWCFDARSGLRPAVGRGGCLAAAALFAAAAYQSFMMAREQKSRTLFVNAGAFGSLALTSAASALTDAGAGSLFGRVGALTAAFTAFAAAFFGLTRAHAHLACDPPRKDLALAVGAASVVAAGAALRLLL